MSTRAAVILLIYVLPIDAAWSQRMAAVDSLSSIRFSIDNFGLAVDGRISGLEGFVQLDTTYPVNSEIALSVRSHTIETGIGLRDRHLKKKEYLDTESFPYIKFVSDDISVSSNGVWMISGQLQIKNTALPISVPVKVTQRQNRIYLTGHFIINRLDFGIGSKSFAMADKVTVVCEIVAMANGR